MGKRIIKMHGTTPTGRSRSYSYYATMQKVNGRKVRVTVEEIDEQIPSLLEGLHVSPEALPKVKEMYREHIAALQGPTVQERVSELEDRIERLKEEEAALARLYARGKLTDKNYDSLHHEWQSKVFETQREIGRLESDTKETINDLDHALFLLTLAPMIFDRLETRSKRRLLQILFKRIIIDTQGKITRVELNPPFEYLATLPHCPNGREKPAGNGAGSKQLCSSQFDAKNRSGK